jgi:ARG/rhodanese/phosphatase superfamily protein
MSIKAGSSQVLCALLSGEDLRYGDPQSFAGLTLIPLFSARQAPFEYFLLSAAITAGTASIEEVGGGRVPTLRIVNSGEKPVLLVDGEHLVGVKQNRILNTTILVPEKSALDIPVSCVEAGRWGVPQGDARPSSPHLFTSARAKKAEAVTASVRSSGAFVADQAAIWEDVDRKLSDLGVPSPTAAMHVAYEYRAADIDQYLRHLPWCPGQTGVVAAIGDRILCADAFDRPESLQGLWSRLIPAYAVEAIGHHPKGTVGAGDAPAFLQEAASADITEHPAVGRGTDLRLTGNMIVGAALEAEQTIVHLALFRTEKRAETPHVASFATVAQRRQRKVV